MRRTHGRLVISILATTAIAMVATACGSTPASTSPIAATAAVSSGAGSTSSSPVSSAAASPAASGAATATWYDDIPVCPTNPLYRCGTLEVPLDHTVPDGEKITVAYYVRPHTDAAAPPLEPVVSIPGGPGYAALDASDVLAASWLTEDHDVILMDRRGTGASSPIDCMDLQDGFASVDELVAATAACGRQLGGASDRYGAGDSALDIESIRQSLGLDTISLLGFSRGTEVAQAYAARFPDRVRAMILDGGILASDPAHRFGWDLGKPAAWIESLRVGCLQAAACTSLFPDPASVVDRLFEAVRKAPFRATVDGAATTADELQVALLLGSVDVGGPDPQTFLTAATDALDGKPDDLVRLAAAQQLWVGDQGPVATYSAGMGTASVCNDEALAWDRSDPPATRRSKLDAAIKSLPTDAFAPVSVATWMQWDWPQSCLEWPEPDRLEPEIPVDAGPITVPTLLLVGNRDMQTPLIQAQGIQAAIPGSILALIDGAGHGATRGGPKASCAGQLAAGFLKDLTADPNACAPGT